MRTPDPRPATPLSAPVPSNGCNPVLVRVRRGAEVESVHRGSWVLVDVDGTVLAGAGNWDAPVYARSSIKAVQALPLVETGAADRFGFETRDLAVAVASHSAERCHVEAVRGILERLGLTVEHLRCGSQVPDDPEVREELRRSGEKPSAVHNNCSGKHAGFLALALHLGVPVERYLDPEGEGQRRVRRALAEMGELAADGIEHALDGCSAPAFRVPLRGIATAFARLTNPADLGAERAAACRRITDAVARHPVLIAGSRGRLCTDLSRATEGRLFPKIGAEAVYAIGEVGGGRALAVKVDDGGRRGLHALVTELVEHLGLALGPELERLGPWRDRVERNRAGLDVGRIEVELP